MYTLKHQRPRLITQPVLFLILCFFITSCKVMLIGAYDQVTDQGIQKIQCDVSTLLVRIEKNISENTPAANQYDSLRNYYIDIEGQLKSLQIRCNSLPKYNIVISQLNLLEENIHKMEALNKMGFNAGIIQIIDSNFQVQFAAITALQHGLKRQKN